MHKAMAGMLAAGALLVGAETASAHNYSTWGWTTSFAERKLDRTYYGGPHDCDPYGRRIRGGFYKHFICSDDESTFELHVTGQHRFRLVSFERY